MLRLQVKPNLWSCLAASAAMALDIATEEFYRLAGHDGGKVVFPWLSDPLNRRGFHIQEAVWVAMQLGYSMTPFELFPQLEASSIENKPRDTGYILPVAYGYARGAGNLGENWEKFQHLIATGQGVIECQTRLNNWHAVAYGQGTIFNPDGEAYPYSRENCEARGLFTKRLWQVTKCSPK